MLVNLSRTRRVRSLELVDLLLACHERIRYFVSLAREAGIRRDVSKQEVVEACLRVEQYFLEALPLHVKDEEQSVVRRVSPDARLEKGVDP